MNMQLSQDKGFRNGPFSGKEGTFMTVKALRCRPTGCFVRLAGGIFLRPKKLRVDWDRMMESS